MYLLETEILLLKSRNIPFKVAESSQQGVEHMSLLCSWITVVENN